MNFLLGLSLLVILIPFNRFALKIIEKLPPSASQGMLFAMVFGNMIFALGWALGLEPEVTNMNSFLIIQGFYALFHLNNLVHFYQD